MRLTVGHASLSLPSDTSEPPFMRSAFYTFANAKQNQFKPVLTGLNWLKPVLTGFSGDGRDESSCQTSVYCHIRLLVQQRKLTSCSRGKPRLFIIPSHTVGKCLRRDKNHDSHSRRGSGRGLYANVDQ